MPWNYQMGLGWETDRDEKYPGRINSTLYGETPQRGFYRRWLEFMTSEKWPVVDAMREAGE
jgi:3-phenylpropionate/trans-cinnamate dioxygenase alpha subunit